MRGLRLLVLWCVGLGLFAGDARADDPSCAVRSSGSRVTFAQRGPVEFGPGFMGTAGSSMLGLRYNFLLNGDYDWVMNGQLRARWPPPLRVSAEGDPGGGRLTVQYGLRLQFWLRLFGTEFEIPIPMWVGVDRSERGMSTFTPWAWTGMDTAVRVTAHERLLRADSIMVPAVGQVNYQVFGSYEMTTTVQTREINFPQAMSSITATTPEADVAPTANGDMNMPARWLGVLRYVGALRLRVVVDYPLCLAGACVRRMDTIFNEAIPFASRSEQQMSVDRTVRLPLPGLGVDRVTVNFGRVRLGLLGRELLTLRNAGSVTVLATPGPLADARFQCSMEPLCIPGGGTRQLSVRFVPDAVGHVETDLLVDSSAPGVPQVQVRLVGDAVDDSTPPPPDAGVGPEDGGIVLAQDGALRPGPEGGMTYTVEGAAQDAGCACGVVGGERARPRPGYGWVFVLAAILGGTRFSPARRARGA